MNKVFNREPRNIVALYAFALIVFSTIWLTACSSGSPVGTNTNKAETPPPASTAATTEQSVPKALADAGEYGENIYDYAQATDWQNAVVKLAALKGAVTNVR